MAFKLILKELCEEVKHKHCCSCNRFPNTRLHVTLVLWLYEVWFSSENILMSRSGFFQVVHPAEVCFRRIWRLFSLCTWWRRQVGCRDCAIGRSRGCSWACCSEEQRNVPQCPAGARTQSGKSWRDSIWAHLHLSSLMVITEGERA